MAKETWTATECAEFCGLARDTWTSYVSRGQAPKPLPGFDEQRQRRWSAELVREWQANRPGPGARTDLKKP